MTEEKKEMEQKEDIKPQQEPAGDTPTLDKADVKPETATGQEKSEQEEKPVEETPKPEPKAEESPKQEEKPVEETPKPEPKAEESPKQEEKPAEETPKPGEAAKKNKKIKSMSLKEIDAKLKIVKEKMGNLKSRYAKQLLKQKDVLDNAVKR